MVQTVADQMWLQREEGSGKGRRGTSNWLFGLGVKVDMEEFNGESDLRYSRLR